MASPSASFIRRKRQLSDKDDEQRKILKNVMEQNMLPDYEEYKIRQCSMNFGPAVVQSLFSSRQTLFIALLVFRILNGFFVQTYYVPDEYWQSVEVAHKYAFGYGFLTWEWRIGIRSYIYPMVFGLIFRVLSFFNADNWAIVIKFPRILQSIFAAITDLYLFKLSEKVSGRSVAKWTLFCQCMCWFVFFSSPRTLANNIEALLTVVSFYYFPKLDKSTRFTKENQWAYVIFVSLGFVIRPTAAVQFLPLIVYHAFYLLDARRSNISWNLSRNLWTIIRLLACAALIIYFSIWIDSACYGTWTVSTWNFVKLNVLRGIGSFYGTHPWHWYFSQGIPVILCSLIIPCAIGFYQNRDRVLFQITVAWTVFVYSLLAHKEFRFLYSIMPIAMHFAGSGMNTVWLFAATRNRKLGKDLPSENRKNWIGNLMLLLILATNLPLACYTSLVHQRGTLDVMKLARDHSVDRLHRNLKPSILFLMPCHSTPYYSHVHMNVTMRFLTCEPDVFTYKPDPNYIDEADVFYNNPSKWLSDEYPLDKVKSLPSLIVMFSNLQPEVHDFLLNNSYVPCGHIFHTHFPTSRRISTHILAYCRKII